MKIYRKFKKVRSNTNVGQKKCPIIVNLKCSSKYQLNKK